MRDANRLSVLAVSLLMAMLMVSACSMGQPANPVLANPAANEVGGMLALTQAVQNLQRIRIDVAAGDRVLLPRHDPRFNHRAALYQKRHESELSR